jgi:NADH-quinone oxidoreductase subunit G
LIYAGTVLPDGARNAAVVLPIANVAEEDGTFVNRDGRVQRYFQAKPAPGMARPAWWVLSELAAAAGRGERVASAGEAFERLSASVDGLRGLVPV